MNCRFCLTPSQTLLVNDLHLCVKSNAHLYHLYNHLSVPPTAMYPDRTGVHLQCPAVHTADTLQYFQYKECTCSVGCKIAVRTAKPMQCTCSPHCMYTAHTLQMHSSSIWVGQNITTRCVKMNSRQQISQKLWTSYT